MPQIAGARALIQQVLVNLVTNAADAIDGAGEVTIRTRLVRVLPSHLLVEPSPAERYVAIAVTDTGRGIAPEHLERLSEPFFTTKGSAGTGLGLTSVARVLQWHGGGLHVASRLGAGSTFSVFLPVHPVASAGGALASSAEAALMAGLSA